MGWEGSHGMETEGWGGEGRGGRESGMEEMELQCCHRLFSMYSAIGI